MLVYQRVSWNHPLTNESSHSPSNHQMFWGTPRCKSMNTQILNSRGFRGQKMSHSPTMMIWYDGCISVFVQRLLNLDPISISPKIGTYFRLRVKLPYFVQLPKKNPSTKIPSFQAAKIKTIFHGNPCIRDGPQWRKSSTLETTSEVPVDGSGLLDERGGFRSLPQNLHGNSPWT